MSFVLSDDLLQELRDKTFRDAFVSAHAKQSIPTQIADLLEQADLSQVQLAKRAGVAQATVSRAADPDYGDLGINTLVKIANGFDVAFVAHFVPFSQLLRWFKEQREVIPTFEQKYETNVSASSGQTESTESSTSDVVETLEQAQSSRDLSVRSGRSMARMELTHQESAGDITYVQANP